MLSPVKRWVLAILAMLAFAARGSGWLRSRFALLTSVPRAGLLMGVRDEETFIGDRTKKLDLGSALIGAGNCLCFDPSPTTGRHWDAQRGQGGPQGTA